MDSFLNEQQFSEIYPFGFSSEAFNFEEQDTLSECFIDPKLTDGSSISQNIDPRLLQNKLEKLDDQYIRCSSDAAPSTALSLLSMSADVVEADGKCNVNTQQTSQQRPGKRGLSHQPYSMILFDCLSSKPPDCQMSLQEIYTWFQDTEKARSAPRSTWEKSIRHNLSMNRGFQKGPRKGKYRHRDGIWHLSDEAIARGYIQPTTPHRNTNPPQHRATSKAHPKRPLRPNPAKSAAGAKGGRVRAARYRSNNSSTSQPLHAVPATQPSRTLRFVASHYSDVKNINTSPYYSDSAPSGTSSCSIQQPGANRQTWKHRVGQSPRFVDGLYGSAISHSRYLNAVDKNTVDGIEHQQSMHGSPFIDTGHPNSLPTSHDQYGHQQQAPLRWNPSTPTLSEAHHRQPTNIQPDPHAIYTEGGWYKALPDEYAFTSSSGGRNPGNATTTFWPGAAEGTTSGGGHTYPSPDMPARLPYPSM